MTAEAYVPLYYAPGEAYQFDWSHEIVVISGVTVTVKVAHVRLCHSRMMFVRAYMRESQEMVFDAHDRAFAFFKGNFGRRNGVKFASRLTAKAAKPLRRSVTPAANQTRVFAGTGITPRAPGSAAPAPQAHSCR